MRNEQEAKKVKERIEKLIIDNNCSFIRIYNEKRKKKSYIKFYSITGENKRIKDIQHLSLLCFRDVDFFDNNILIYYK